MQIDCNSILTRYINNNNFNHKSNTLTKPICFSQVYSVSISNESKIENLKNQVSNPHFPPKNAPTGVISAWNTVNSSYNIPDEVKSIVIRGPFFAAEASANIKYSPDGTPIGIYEKGEKGYVDIYSDSEFTYRGLIDKMLKDLDKGSGTVGNNYYQTTKNFLNDLDQAFVKNGVV